MLDEPPTTPVLLLARQGEAIAAQDIPRSGLLQVPVERLCGFVRTLNQHHALLQRLVPGVRDEREAAELRDRG